MLHMNERTFGLDFLRALAIFFVVYGHSLHLLPNNSIKEVLSLFVLDGVSIFFVLSGFLIGRILLRTMTQDALNSSMLLNFWARRWWRTLPSYYLVLTVLIFLNLVLNDHTPAIPNNITGYFFFFQNFSWPHPEFFGEAWSLAVEEWFYLCLPIPIFLARRFFKIQIAPLTLSCVAIVVIGSFLYRAHVANTSEFANQTEWSYALRMQVLTRMDSLMLGVLGAYISVYREDRWAKLSGLHFIIAGAFLLVFDKSMHVMEVQPYIDYISLSAAPLATFLLLPSCSAWNCNPNAATRLITFMSVTSYAIYLVNQGLVLETIIPAIMPKLAYYFWRLSEHLYVIELLCFWSLTFSISFVLYRYYEIPMTSLRNRWAFSTRPVTS